MAFAYSADSSSFIDISTPGGYPFSSAATPWGAPPYYPPYSSASIDPFSAYQPPYIPPPFYPKPSSEQDFYSRPPCYPRSLYPPGSSPNSSLASAAASPQSPPPSSGRDPSFSSPQADRPPVKSSCHSAKANHSQSLRSHAKHSGRSRESSSRSSAPGHSARGSANAAPEASSSCPSSHRGKPDPEQAPKCPSSSQGGSLDSEEESLIQSGNQVIPRIYAYYNKYYTSDSTKDSGSKGVAHERWRNLEISYRKNTWKVSEEELHSREGDEVDSIASAKDYIVCYLMRKLGQDITLRYAAGKLLFFNLLNTYKGFQDFVQITRTQSILVLDVDDDKNNYVHQRSLELADDPDHAFGAVQKFLLEIRMDDYLELFQYHKLTMEQVMDLDHQGLKEIGLNKFGDIKKLENEINRRKKRVDRQRSDTDDTSAHKHSAQLEKSTPATPGDEELADKACLEDNPVMETQMQDRKNEKGN